MEACGKGVELQKVGVKTGLGLGRGEGGACIGHNRFMFGNACKN